MFQTWRSLALLRIGIPFVTAPSLLFHPLCLAALKQAYPFLPGLAGPAKERTSAKAKAYAHRAAQSTPTDLSGGGVSASTSTPAMGGKRKLSGQHTMSASVTMTDGQKAERARNGWIRWPGLGLKAKNVFSGFKDRSCCSGVNRCWTIRLTGSNTWQNGCMLTQTALFWQPRSWHGTAAGLAYGAIAVHSACAGAAVDRAAAGITHPRAAAACAASGPAAAMQSMGQQQALKIGQQQPTGQQRALSMGQQQYGSPWDSISAYAAHRAAASFAAHGALEGHWKLWERT
eukprot:173442-Chlamydomonas_euryale.AAC.2